MIGLGFLTKQFQVLLVLPGFGLAMLLLSPTPWPRRLLDAVVALGAMVVGAGWWVLLTVLVPSGSRPYFGGSQTDSFIELTFSYNGLGRLTGNETGSVILGANEALGASRAACGAKLACSVCGRATLATRSPGSPHRLRCHRSRPYRRHARQKGTGLF
ncbi:MAG: hypothetical protein ACLU0O_11500 [Collinsella sp.]